MNNTLYHYLDTGKKLVTLPAPPKNMDELEAEYQGKIARLLDFSEINEATARAGEAVKYAKQNIHLVPA